MKNFTLRLSSTLAALIFACTNVAQASTSADNRKYLLDTQQQVESMRAQVHKDGLFTKAFQVKKAYIDSKLALPVNVPFPKDAGGGYTHEVHKKNYADMRTAGRLFVLTQDQKYADFVKNILLAYAKMYPTLGLHPEQKEQSPGKLFWQSLNEAVWLVYTSQAYDSVKDALSSSDKQSIEANLFDLMADYLSEQSPQTFDKIHNHGTWATAAVGMTGYVLGKQEWVEKALYGLDKSGKGGFVRQLDELFSPEGYYNEGPYYQRYALMPFVLFAQAIENNEPQRKIFEYRNGILEKAINTTIQLSYNGLFFGINDAIKDKGIDTSELVHGVAIAYNKSKETGLLTIAQEQNNILLTGYGLSVANALDNKIQTPYPFASTAFGDGVNGDEGALVVLRQNQAADHQTLVFKATSQGLGHGHFDKLHWMFYNKGDEIVYDYGAARFLNIEAKYGGHYLPENNTYAKQTIAHNTLVVDEISHFNGELEAGNQSYPTVLFNEFDENIQASSAVMENAYEDTVFSRTQALVNAPSGHVFVLDVLDVISENKHQYDVPVHFLGQFIDTNVDMQANTTSQSPLGTSNGYQHLWLQATGTPKEDLAKVTWLNDKTFYTHSTVVADNQSLLLTRIGANDPDVNLIANQAIVNRVNSKGNHQFLSLLEVHGEYNPTVEFTRDSHSQLTSLTKVEVSSDRQLEAYRIEFKSGEGYLVVIAKHASKADVNEFSYNNKKYAVTGSVELVTIK